MMDQYAYLLLGVTLIAVDVALLTFRKDLLSLSLKIGAIAAVGSPLVDLIYFRDYYRPPSFLGSGIFPFEDMLFGAGITVLGIIVYTVISQCTFTRGGTPAYLRHYLLLLAGIALAILIFNFWLGINSIFVSSGALALAALNMLYIRRDLIRPAFITAAALTIVAILLYVLLFDILAPHFWDRYWLARREPWAVTIFGNVPVVELLWYFATGLMFGASYPFARGAVLKKIERRTVD